MRLEFLLLVAAAFPSCLSDSGKDPPRDSPRDPPRGSGRSRGRSAAAPRLLPAPLVLRLPPEPGPPRIRCLAPQRFPGSTFELFQGIPGVPVRSVPAAPDQHWADFSLPGAARCLRCRYRSHNGSAWLESEPSAGIGSSDLGDAECHPGATGPPPTAGTLRKGRSWLLPISLGVAVPGLLLLLVAAAVAWRELPHGPRTGGAVPVRGPGGPGCPPAPTRGAGSVSRCPRGSRLAPVTGSPPGGPHPPSGAASSPLNSPVPIKVFVSSAAAFPGSGARANPSVGGSSKCCVPFPVPIPGVPFPVPIPGVPFPFPVSRSHSRCSIPGVPFLFPFPVSRSHSRSHSRCPVPIPVPIPGVPFPFLFPFPVFHSRCPIPGVPFPVSRSHSRCPIPIPVPVPGVPFPVSHSRCSIPGVPFPVSHSRSHSRCPVPILGVPFPFPVSRSRSHSRCSIPRVPFPFPFPFPFLVFHSRCPIRIPVPIPGVPFPFSVSRSHSRCPVPVPIPGVPLPSRPPGGAPAPAAAARGRVPRGGRVFYRGVSRGRGACPGSGGRGPGWAGRGAVQDGRGVGVPRRAAPHGRGRERGDPAAPGAAAAPPRGPHRPRQRRHRPLRPGGCLRVQVLRVPRDRVQPGGEAILHHHPGLQQRPAAIRDPQRFLLLLQHPEELPGPQHGALGVQRAHGGVLGSAVLPVLRVPVAAAEHDAGLRAHGDVPARHPAEPQRLQGQDRPGRGLRLGNPLLLRGAGRGAENLRGGSQHHGPARRGAGEEQQPDGADRGDPGQGGGGVAARAGGHHHLRAHGLHALQRAHARELPARQEVPEAQWKHVPHDRGRAPGALHGRAALHGAVHQGQLLVPALLPRRRPLGAARRRRGRVLQAARGGHLRHPDFNGQIRQIHRQLLGSQGGRLAQDRNPLQIPHAALGAGARPGLLVRRGLHRLHNDGVALDGPHGAADALVPGALPVPVAALRQGRRHALRDLPAHRQQETELRHQHRGPGGPDGLQVLQPPGPEKPLLQVHGHDPLAPPRLPLHVAVGEHVEHGQQLQHEHGHGRGRDAGGVRPEQRHRRRLQRGPQQPDPVSQHRHRQPHPLQDGLHHEHGHRARLVQRSERRRLQHPLPPEQPVHHGRPPHLHGLPHVHHHQHHALRQLKGPRNPGGRTKTGGSPLPSPAPGGHGPFPPPSLRAGPGGDFLGFFWDFFGIFFCLFCFSSVGFLWGEGRGGGGRLEGSWFL